MVSSKTLVLAFENCREYDKEENCATTSETNAFWANPSLAIQATFLLDTFQVDMKNVSSPLQRVKFYGDLVVNPRQKVWKRLNLASNEFTSYEDYIGLFPEEPRTTKFFSLEKESIPAFTPVFQD